MTAEQFEALLADYESVMPPEPEVSGEEVLARLESCRLLEEEE